MTRQRGEIERFNCRGCGRIVYITHHGPKRGFTTHHQHPICDAWACKMAELKPESEHLTLLPDDYGAIKR